MQSQRTDHTMMKDSRSNWKKMLLFHLQMLKCPAAFIPLYYHAEFVAEGKEINLESL